MWAEPDAFALALQLATLRTRVYAQAAGERAAGVATWMGTPPIPGETVALYSRGW